MRRIFSIQTSLHGDTLLAKSATITEHLGKPFQIELDLLSREVSIDFDKLLGSKVTLTLSTRLDSPRYFNGLVAGFSQTGSFGRFETYRARVVPWLWFLSRTADCCIFQNMSAPAIVKEVFERHGFTDFKDTLTKSYRVRDYCVQYRETDLNFVQRLLEEEGIYYYFHHTDSVHTLVLADDYGAHGPYPGYESIDYRPPDNHGQHYDDVIEKWQLARNIQTGRYVVNDYDFTKPRVSLVTQSFVSRAFPRSDLEMFDYPGKYSTLADGDHYARVRLESLQAQYETVRGSGSARGLAAGSLFELKKHPRQDQNREYLIVSATYRLDTGRYESGEGEPEQTCQCSFEAMYSRQPFRPARTAVATRVSGPQTAVVVGQSGEEIFTDEYARVKVKFHWDRDPKFDESSSCWVRVSQTWAHREWGSITVPRIGQEVIVEFLEGDPDRPLITGCVYNQMNMPPFKLPAAATVMGFRSKTHKGGGYNEMTLDDATGQQRITIHAQKDLNTTVQDSETHVVKSGSRALTVETGTNTETIKAGAALTVQAGARTVDVTGGDYSATSSQAVQLHGKGAGVGITGNVGGVTMLGDGKGVSITGNHAGTSITGNHAGVTITGNDKGVTINGHGKGVTIAGDTEGVTISGTSKGVSLFGTPSFYAEGTATATIQSPVVNIGDEQVTITGTTIVLQAGGGSITIDSSGVTIVGTIVKIN